MKIIALGNAFLQEDSGAKNTAGLLEKDFDVIKVRSLTGLEENLDRKELTVILDVVKNLKEIKVFESLKEFKNHKKVSAHDLDSLFYLRLLEKVGEIGDHLIIGIPIDFGPEKSKEKVREILRDLN